MLLLLYDVADNVSNISLMLKLKERKVFSAHK